MQSDEKETKSNDIDCIKALGKLQHSIELIIKNSPELEKDGIVSMLKLAFEQSEIDCSIIVEKQIKEAKEV